MKAQECKNIIRSFKVNMAPKTKNTGSIGGSGVFLKTPNVFELRYKKGGREHPFLHKFKQCFPNKRICQLYSRGCIYNL